MTTKGRGRKLLTRISYESEIELGDASIINVVKSHYTNEQIKEIIGYQPQTLRCWVTLGKEYGESRRGSCMKLLQEFGFRWMILAAELGRHPRSMEIDAVIEAKRDAQGRAKASITCDQCGFVDSVPCAHVKTRGGPDEIDYGMVNRKIVNKGWIVNGNEQICPTCKAANRKKSEEIAMQKAAIKESEKLASVGPSYRMTAEIYQMLEASFDKERMRYANIEDTDDTIALAIGNGCHTDWVKQVREAEFGKDIRETIAGQLRTEIDQLTHLAGNQSELIGNLTEQQAVIQQRLDAALEKWKDML